MTTTQQVFRRRIARLILVPLIVSSLIAGVLELQVRRLASAEAWVDHTDVVLAQGRLLLRAIIDQETGLRGYELTHDERFMQPYRAASATLDALFPAIQNLISDNPAQQKEFNDIRASYDAWHRYAEDAIARIRRNDPAVSSVAFNLRGKQLMDDVRIQQQEFVDGEDRLKLVRAERSREVGRTLTWTLLGLMIVFAATLLYETFGNARAINAEYTSILAGLEQRSSELFESRERLQVTLQSIGDAVIVTDSAGSITFLNPIAEHLTQQTQQMALGKPLEQVFRIVNEETRLTIESPFAKVRRLGTVVGLANHTLLLRADGSEIAIDDSGAPIRDANGQILGVVLVFRDVTEQKEMMKALQTSEKLAAAGKLSASIAHEIHNPLETVRNLFFLIRKRSNPDLETLIGMAERELSRVVQITKNMLSLYRESKKVIPLNLREVIDDVAALMQRSFRDKNIRYTAEFATETLISGFPAEMRQVVSNLLSNAVDAVPAGGKVLIRLEDSTLRDSRAGVALLVSDDGPGIPEDVLPKIFRPFFTTKGEKGTGLGLWIVHDIVAKHGGYIEAASQTTEANHGTTFTVMFPAYPVLQAPRGIGARSVP